MVFIHELASNPNLGVKITTWAISLDHSDTYLHFLNNIAKGGHTPREHGLNLLIIIMDELKRLECIKWVNDLSYSDLKDLKKGLVAFNTLKAFSY